MQIGPYKLNNRLILAPMAGVTDRPFRELCLKFNAGMTVSEMMSSNPDVWHSKKSKHRLVDRHESGIRSVQIAGSNPHEMALAAEYCVENGAQIIDINMGCPVKKVNKKLAGSALLKQPELVREILETVVNAVKVPVTLKTRTGWDKDNINCTEIAKIAEQSGIQAIAIHGRTRDCMYRGQAEYQNIKAVKQVVTIPVIANGDITSPEQAKHILDYTQADALMIGRAAQGRPWIFKEIQNYLTTGTLLEQPSVEDVFAIMIDHVNALHQFYGALKGLRIARKHVGWYLANDSRIRDFRNSFYKIETAEMQLEILHNYLENIA